MKTVESRPLNFFLRSAYPDIETLEDLSGALGLSLMELMHSERLPVEDKTIIPKALAVAISSIAFGMIHMHAFTLPEMLYVLPYIGGGVLWSVLLLKQKNITQLYVIHILTNLTGIIYLVTSL